MENTCLICDNMGYFVAGKDPKGRAILEVCECDKGLSLLWAFFTPEMGNDLVILNLPPIES